MLGIRHLRKKERKKERPGFLCPMFIAGVPVRRELVRLHGERNTAHHLFVFLIFREFFSGEIAAACFALWALKTR